MARMGTSKTGQKPRLLLLQEDGAGKTPTVRELDYDGNMSPNHPESGPEKLHDWLCSNQICPCPPRQYAEAELARRMEELARSNYELEQFAYVASHDLREPLRMVATYTQLLAERYRGQLDEKAQQYIAYASDGALRMQALVQDLLALSRIGQEPLPLRQVDCNAVLADVVRDLEAAIAESSAIVQLSKLPVVHAQPSLMRQVFQNLIGNAIKFRGKEQPLVRVSAEPREQRWLFSVSDNGIGIAPECQASIFKIFQRLHARGEYPGNGIGLAICQKIVEHYGGRIWVESQPGCGSNFRFTVPMQAHERTREA
jgi:light-regulated signal transduction histidine kinase (bacteriophytochrome)